MKKVNLNEMVHTKQRDQIEICVNNKLAEIWGKSGAQMGLKGEFSANDIIKHTKGYLLTFFNSFSLPPSLCSEEKLRIVCFNM